MKPTEVREPEPGLDLRATIWNAFVDLLAMSNPSALSPEQKPAQLVFWYESEVQNGGHLQYFLNRGSAEAEEAILALRHLNASTHSTILAAALERWNVLPRAPATVHEYVEEALESEFTSFDDDFFAAEPLQQVLENYLDQNRDVFVVLHTA